MERGGGELDYFTCSNSVWKTVSDSFLSLIFLSPSVKIVLLWTLGMSCRGVTGEDCATALWLSWGCCHEVYSTSVGQAACSSKVSDGSLWCFPEERLLCLSDST